MTVSSESISAGTPRLWSRAPAFIVHRLGQHGNRLARREIWLWVMTLIKPTCQVATFRSYYQRLRERGVVGKVAVGHVAGKLISVLFFCLRSGEPYDPDRHARDLGLCDA